MARICNFPISQTKRCKQPVADGKPNCGRHNTNLSADQLGQSPTVYEKDDELHVWADKPDNPYCLIHGDPAYQVLCQVAGEVPPCCLNEKVEYKDRHGKLHRDDGPALIRPDGTQVWYQHGKLHRDDGPAAIDVDGTQSWWQHGKRHRNNGPAMTWASGEQQWYQHGEQHRDDGPAWVLPDGTQIWCQHDQWHRDDGPAVVTAIGYQGWHQYGKRHRDDGPARVWLDGTQEWWWRGKQVTEEEHARLREQSESI